VATSRCCMATCAGGSTRPISCPPPLAVVSIVDDCVRPSERTHALGAQPDASLTARWQLHDTKVAGLRRIESRLGIVPRE
jgi:hypothetical protein